jgi:hypothetical protein
MSWAADALKSLKKVILIEEKISSLSEDVKLLALRCQNLSERLARVEGKFEAYERVATATATVAAQQKRLPSREKR